MSNEYISGTRLLEEQIAANHTISFYECAPGTLAIRQQFSADQCTRDAQQAVYHCRSVLQGSHRGQLSLSQLYKELFSDAVPDKLVQADERASRIAALHAQLRHIRRADATGDPVVALGLSTQTTVPTPGPSSGRRVESEGDRDIAFEGQCPNDGRWHSWECDGIWFEQTFCAPARIEHADVFCALNYRWAQDWRRDVTYFSTLVCNASFEVPALFQSWTWHSGLDFWNDHWHTDHWRMIPPRCIDAWTYISPYGWERKSRAGDDGPVFQTRVHFLCAKDFEEQESGPWNDYATMRKQVPWEGIISYYGEWASIGRVEVVSITNNSWVAIPFLLSGRPVGACAPVANSPTNTELLNPGQTASPDQMRRIFGTFPVATTTQAPLILRACYPLNWPDALSVRVTYRR